MRKKGRSEAVSPGKRKKLLRGRYPLFEILHTLLTSEKEPWGFPIFFRTFLNFHIFATWKFSSTTTTTTKQQLQKKLTERKVKKTFGKVLKMIINYSWLRDDKLKPVRILNGVGQLVFGTPPPPSSSWGEIGCWRSGGRGGYLMTR